MCLWLHCIYRCIWKSQACFCKRSYFLTCWEETQLLLQLCLHTPTCWNAKTNANSSLWVVLFLSGLFSFAPFNLKKKCLPYFSLVHSLFIRLSSCLSPDAAQLYQQYSEAAQNSEILRQARSEFLSVSEDQTSSPLPSPPPARRALPPIPPQPHPKSFSHTGSFPIQSLHLPECPRGERRASSPRLSISQSSSLWRDLPGVRNSAELDELTEDQRRLQEVTLT